MTRLVNMTETMKNLKKNNKVLVTAGTIPCLNCLIFITIETD